MKCHLGMKLHFFLMISLNFCFLDFVTCSIQRNKFCMYLSFFHPIIAHYFARVKQIHLSYLFHFLTNCVPRAPKKRHYGRNILFKFYPSFYDSVNSTFLRDSLKRRAPVNCSDHSLRISFNLKVLF